jgi:hypothetical protein
VRGSDLPRFFPEYWWSPGWPPSNQPASPNPAGLRRTPGYPPVLLATCSILLFPCPQQSSNGPLLSTGGTGSLKQFDTWLCYLSAEGRWAQTSPSPRGSGLSPPPLGLLQAGSGDRVLAARGCIVLLWAQKFLRLCGSTIGKNLSLGLYAQVCN